MQIPAGPAAMRLVHVDLFAVENELFHLASKGRWEKKYNVILGSTPKGIIFMRASGTSGKKTFSAAQTGPFEALKG